MRCVGVGGERASHSPTPSPTSSSSFSRSRVTWGLNVGTFCVMCFVASSLSYRTVCSLFN